MKIKIALVFGGPSVEHEISIITALQAYNNYKNDTYELMPVYYSKEQKFYYGKKLLDINNYKDINKTLLHSTMVSFNSNKKGPYFKSKLKKVYFDAVWVVCHGNKCEDGTLYNFFNVLNIPCIALDSFQGSISQDKVLCKQILQSHKIKQAKYFYIEKYDYDYNSDNILNKVKEIGYPVIIKPAKLGSSVGINICHNDSSFIDAIEECFKYDYKIIIEEFIENANEYNISLLGCDGNYKTSIIEEVTKSSFLTYDDKYNSSYNNKGMAGLNRILPADISKKLEQKIIATSKKIATALSSSLCVRLDFLYDSTNDILYFNEINNIPGSLAFYLWEKSGLSFSDLIDEILDIGIESEYNKQDLTSHYDLNVFSTNEIQKITISK